MEGVMSNEEPAPPASKDKASSPGLKELWNISSGVLDESEFVTSNRTLIVTGALAGVSIVIVSTLLSLFGQALLDTPLWVSLYAVAVALPALATRNFTWLLTISRQKKEP
jgi:hypothetical protein